MRKLILKMSISVDGFVGGPNGEIDWIFRSTDGAAAAWIIERLWQAGVHIMGSRTFQDMAAYWPTSTEPFAAPMNEVPKVVFSRTGALAPAGTGTTTALRDARSAAGTDPAGATAALSGEASSWTQARVARGDLAAEIANLKKEPGKDILAHGGARFAQGLVGLGLVTSTTSWSTPWRWGAGWLCSPHGGVRGRSSAFVCLRRAPRAHRRSAAEARALSTARAIGTACEPPARLRRHPDGPFDDEIE
jgi:dihydrofolate reductase